MENVNILDIDGTQWEIQDVVARNKITELQTNFNSLTNYQKDIEINTGTKWIDGKTIYRKVFYSPTNWSSDSFLGNIKNIDVVIKIISTSQYGDGNWFTNYDKSELENVAFVTQDGNVGVSRAGAFKNKLKAVVIVEYTKTTD